jgi:hypothetical protein
VSTAQDWCKERRHHYQAPSDYGPGTADHDPVSGLTLSLVFYHRQVRSHARRKCDTFHALAKRFAYWFLAVSPNTS